MQIENMLTLLLFPQGFLQLPIANPSTDTSPQGPHKSHNGLIQRGLEIGNTFNAELGVIGQKRHRKYLKCPTTRNAIWKVAVPLRKPKTQNLQNNYGESPESHLKMMRKSFRTQLPGRVSPILTEIGVSTPRCFELSIPCQDTKELVPGGNPQIPQIHQLNVVTYGGHYSINHNTARCFFFWGGANHKLSATICVLWSSLIIIWKHPWRLAPELLPLN